MKVKHRHARFYSILEVGTLVVITLLYFLVYRPKEKLDAEWNHSNDRGQAALDKGNFAEAQKDFQFSVEFAQKHNKDELNIAGVRDRLADAERGLENYEEALRLDERAQPVFEKYQNSMGRPVRGFSR